MKLHLRLNPFTLCGIWLYQDPALWENEQAVLPHRALPIPSGFELCETCRLNWQRHQEFGDVFDKTGEQIECPCPYHEGR
jgi:hypothetical protein